MARKSLGFVPLIWVCPFCETQNPGPIKSCTSCGAPQPEDVEFLQVEEEEFNFIKDEALIRMAKSGPDIHCPYCGTRNPATAELCKKCGGEIGLGGKARETGKKVLTIQEAQKEKEQAPVPAPEPKKKLSRGCLIFGTLGGLALLAGFIVLLFLLLKTDTISGTVSSVEWERSIHVEAFMPVTKSDWWDEIPDEGEIIACTDKYRYTSEEPQPNATEVCGEEYTEDTGTGIGEVFQDCVYEVYDDYCEYTIMEWTLVDTIVASGNDPDPYWPTVNLNPDQREGERSENYTINFTGDGDTYTYTTSSYELFAQAKPGSRWTLSVNQIGGVQSVEPAN